LAGAFAEHGIFLTIFAGFALLVAKFLIEVEKVGRVRRMVTV
jgi:hypothetical protein